MGGVDELRTRALGTMPVSSAGRPTGISLFSFVFHLGEMLEQLIGDSLLPHNGLSAAILRISLRSSGGIGDRPALHFHRQKTRHPSPCVRTVVNARALITAWRQSNSPENTARLTRVT